MDLRSSELMWKIMFEMMYATIRQSPVFGGEVMSYDEAALQQKIRV